MRKWSIVIAALLITAFLAGCGEDEPAGESAERSHEPPVHSDPTSAYSDIELSEWSFSFSEISLPEESSRSEQSHAPAESSEPEESDSSAESTPVEPSEPEESSASESSVDPIEQSIPENARIYKLDETRFLALDESWSCTDGEPFSAVRDDGTTLTVKTVSLEEHLSGLTEELLAEEMKNRLSELYPASELSVVGIRFAGKDRPVLCIRHDGKVTLEWFLPHVGDCIVVAANASTAANALGAICTVF